MSFRRMLPFLLLNIIVSAVVVLGILTFWNRRNNPPEEELPAVLAQATLAAAVESAGLPTPELIEPVADTAAEGESTGEETAEDGPVVHTVQAGDTLGRISQEFGVSMEDIMAANGLDNPNLLSVGQQLTIPVDGLATATVPAPEATAALPTPIPTEAAAAAGQASIAITTITGIGALDAETIQIVNSGAGEQSLEGWKLRDEDGNMYAFGQVRIFGEGAGIDLHTRIGENTATALYWGLEAPAWRSGELATLWDAADQVVARFTVP